MKKNLTQRRRDAEKRNGLINALENEFLCDFAPLREKNRSLTVAAISLVGILCASLSCNHSDDATSALTNNPTKRPQVYAVNYPLQYFAQRIAGDAADVVFPATPGEDPAFWKPDAETIQKYQQADLILLNGAMYAKWLQTATLPTAKIIDTSGGFQDELIEVDDTVVHSHGPQGEHSHAGTAFTTWLDLTLATRQAEAIHAALAKLLPDQRDKLSQNFAALKDDLTALDEQLKTAAAQFADQPILASHPVYQYFARRYQINLQSVHWEPGEFPSDEQWEQLQQLLEKHPAKLMIWEGQPIQESVDRLTELGVRSVVFDPCGNKPDEGDFLSIMRGNVTNLEQSANQ
jgi:zinc transport system substrate-binding protein